MIYSNKKYSRFVYYVLLALLIFYVGYYLGQRADTSSDGTSLKSPDLVMGQLENPPAGVDFSPIWKTWRIIDEKYIDGVSTTTTKKTDQEKVWGAAAGLVGSLGDPYSTFFAPEDATLFQENINGSFGGVGMEVGMKDGNISVIAPLEGTPAKKAGIRAGDIIVAIDDKPTSGISVDKAVKMIRGEKGTEVKLTVVREKEDEPIDIKIVRDTIQVPVLELGDNTTKDPKSPNKSKNGLRPDGVFVIRLYSFSANSPELFRDALRKFVLSNSNKLILDLRGDPGGYLEAAVDIASWFLPEGKVVVREVVSKNGEEKTHRSKIGRDIFNENLKMAILVDRGSASASEILAGALREHGKAKLVGERTFGKGSVQELIPITDKTFVKLTIAKWLTPNGASISDGGLKPDIEVAITKQDIEAHKDPQMERAAQLLIEGK